ncbi:MAG: LUD domain-containing protein [Ignavibacteriales bacterium]|nr:LUD domain-containing protein [Ignavibacteriales bacterium]MCB9218135.1 LUD domain-containing protein [Ignavibacteriales bacterium]
MSNRNKILSQIKSALKNKSNEEEKIYSISELNDRISETLPKSKTELVEQFKQELLKVNADFFYLNNISEAQEKISEILSENKINHIASTNQRICESIQESIEAVYTDVKFTIANDLKPQERKEKISKINTAIVYADFAVSEIGSLVFLYDNSKTSYPHFLCDYVIAIVNSKNIFPNQFTLFENIDTEQSKNMVFVTGPSRTADIEKVLVLGAHGPRKLTVIAIENE